MKQAMGRDRVELGLEPLEELAWIWDASLALMRRESYPHERWVLGQRGRPVAAIERRGTAWSVTTAAHRCSGAIRRRRLGWHIEVTPSGARSPLIDYTPATVRSGGTLELATGGRYKLRCSPRLGYDWTVATAEGERLARISRRTKPPSGSEAARDLSGLTPAAAQEPHLSLLLGAACVGMAMHYQQALGTG